MTRGPAQAGRVGTVTVVGGVRSDASSTSVSITPLLFKLPTTAGSVYSGGVQGAETSVARMTVVGRVGGVISESSVGCVSIPIRPRMMGVGFSPGLGVSLKFSG